MTKVKAKILIILTAVLLVFLAAVMPFSLISKTYATNSEIKFDDTNVLDDLKSSSVNGKPFNINNYPFDSTGKVKKPQVLNFVEYCYSFKINMQGNYGTYIYFYNPQGLNLNVNSLNNKVQMAVSYDNDGLPKDYDKFSLKFLSKSEESNYKNLFYKFKVIDKIGADGKTILQRVNSNERRYDVSGVELVTVGQQNAIDYPVAGSFKFTGYVKGYGADSNAESNLISTVNELETIELDVRSTNFRTQSSAVGADHRNELNSVYFSVDNSILDKYGKLQKIKAMWYEYKTAPIIVTQNKGLYDTLQNYMGKTLQGGYDSALPYKLGYERNHISTTPTLIVDYGWSYNVKLQSSGNAFITSKDVCNQLCYSFYTNGKSAKDYSIPSKDMANYIYNYDKSFNKGTLDIKSGKISADLFTDSVDSGRTRGENCVEIDADGKYDLFSYNSANSGFWDKVGDYGFWDTLFGKVPTDDSIIGIKPIYAVTDSDVSANNNAIANNLLINENGIDDVGIKGNADYVQGFKSYYENSKKDNKTTYLFRFAVTDYFSGLLYGENANERPVVMKDESYKAQESVFLDFDIIQLTFNKDGVYHVIPVVANPIDIINGIDPPIQFDGVDWWKIILMVLVLIIVLVLIAPLLPHIISFVFWLIKFAFSILLFPFKAIAKAVKKSNNKSREVKK